MKDALMLLDTGNLYYNVNKRFPDHRINYSNFLKAVPKEFSLIKKVAFGSYRKANTRAMSFVSALSKLDFVARFKQLNSEKFYNPLVDMVIEAYENLDVGCIIFGSNNLGLIPLIHKLKEKDIKICIVGCCIPKPFEKVADNIIELNEEYLADGVNNSKR
jgi:hypothetical protein